MTRSPNPGFALPAATLLVGGLLAVVVLLSVAFWAGRCTGDDFNEGQPPEEIAEEDVEDGLGFGSEIPLYQRPVIRQAPVRRQGTAPGAAQASVDSFVAAAQDSARTPIFPTVRGEYRNDRVTLAVTRSDGALVRKEFDCPPPCRFGAGPDSTLFAQHQRAIPRLLPALGKTAALCTAVAGAGYAIAAVSDYDHPGAVAGVAGAGCVLVRVF